MLLLHLPKYVTTTGRKPNIPQNIYLWTKKAGTMQNKQTSPRNSNKSQVPSTAEKAYSEVKKNLLLMCKQPSPKSSAKKYLIWTLHMNGIKRYAQKRQTKRDRK